VVSVLTNVVQEKRLHKRHAGKEFNGSHVFRRERGGVVGKTPEGRVRGWGTGLLRGRVYEKIRRCVLHSCYWDVSDGKNSEFGGALASKVRKRQKAQPAYAVRVCGGKKGYQNERRKKGGQ